MFLLNWAAKSLTQFLMHTVNIAHFSLRNLTQKPPPPPHNILLTPLRSNMFSGVLSCYITPPILITAPPHNVSLTPLKEVRSKCQNGGSDAALKGVSDTLEGVGCCDKFLTMNCSILTVSVKNGRSVVPDKNARTFLSYWDATSLPPFLTQTVNFARFSLRNLPQKSIPPPCTMHHLLPLC